MIGGQSHDDAIFTAGCRLPRSKGSSTPVRLEHASHRVRITHRSQMSRNSSTVKTDDASPRRLTGLAESEAQARQATEGPNELPQPDRRTPLRIVWEVLREPMFSLL